LIEVAWDFHLQGKGYFREAELLGQLPSFLSNSDINIPLQENKAILEEITGSSSLLKEAAYKLYGFLHLTFQEYFAALAAKKKGSIGWQEVVAHRHEPWWEEVILLLAECMDDATPLLLGILGHPLGQLLPGDINQLVPEGEPLAVNDDLFHSDLLLAARCLVGKPHIQMQGLRDRIIAEVKNLLLTSPYKLDWNRAARVLVEIGDEALINDLMTMLADQGVDKWKRQSIALAFGELGDKKAAQYLLEILESNTELNEWVRGSILNALCELKATFAIPMLSILKTQKKNDLIQLQIATALGKLNEKSGELIGMLTDTKLYEDKKIPILRMVGSFGDKSVAPELLRMLLAETTSTTSIKPAIAQALRDLKDKSLTFSILERLQDETLDWSIRWLLTECLEGLQESAISPLKEILENQNIYKPVRVGIAATLGTWGVGESIPYLVEAIESQEVPPNWCLGNSNWIGYVWRRITRTLKSLGDHSIVPKLVEVLGQSTINKNERDLSSAWFIYDEVQRLNTFTREYVPSVYHVQGIIYASLEYKSEAIARQVLVMLREPEWQLHQDVLLKGLPQCATQSLVPELVALLKDGRAYKASYWTWVAIANAIGEFANDCKTVKDLWEIWSATSNSIGESDWADKIYTALYSVSRRARVQVSWDGEIKECKN
jgi:HEAT repeat protein